MRWLKIVFFSILLIPTLVNAQTDTPQIIDDGGLTGAGSWSADGDSVAFLAKNHLLIYDAHQLEGEPRRMVYPFGQALDVAYSPDGRYLATLNLHQTDGLVLYDAQTLEIVQSLNYTGTAMTWSSDGAWLAIGDAYQLRLLETETFTVVHERDIPQAREDHVSTFSYRVEFAFDDQLVMLKYDQIFDYGNHGAEYPSTLFYWINPAAEIEFSSRQRSLADLVGGFAFHPDGVRIVANRRGESFEIVNFETLEILHDLRFWTSRNDNYAHFVPVFSPDGARVAFFKYSYDPLIAQVYVWDVETGGLLSRVDVAGQMGDIFRRQLFFSPDGQRIGFNGYVIEIDSSTVTRLASTELFRSADVAIAAHYTGEIYLSQDGGGAWILLDEVDYPVCYVKFAPNNAYFVVVTCNRQGFLWETQTQRRTALGDVRNVLFSPNSSLMLLVGALGGRVIWDTQTAQSLPVPLESGEIGQNFTPDSRVILLDRVGREDLPYIWNPLVDGDAALVALDISGNAVWNFSPSGAYVVREYYAHDHRYLVALDTRTGEEISRKLLEYEDDVYTYNFSFNTAETEVTYTVEVFFSMDEIYVETWQFR